MKNLKKFIPVFAFVLGIGLVFTQSAFKNATSTTTNWYLIDENTGVLDPSHQVIDPQEFCDEGQNKFCAREYNVSGGVPTTPTTTPVLMKN